jgi:hypothetical protein
MKKFFAFLGALSVSASALAAGTPTVAERFGWMAGCWTGQGGGATFTEIWTPAGPDLMVGLSVTTWPGKPAQFEFIRVQSKDGRLVYVAQPGGTPPTEFEWSAAASTPDTAVFANPQHDFPKRVAYRKVDARRVLAWIDGGADGGKKMEFPMERGGCPGPK